MHMHMLPGCSEWFLGQFLVVASSQRVPTHPTPLPPSIDLFLFIIYSYLFLSASSSSHNTCSPALTAVNLSQDSLFCVCAAFGVYYY